MSRDLQRRVERLEGAPFASRHRAEMIEQAAAAFDRVWAKLRDRLSGDIECRGADEVAGSLMRNGPEIQKLAFVDLVGVGRYPDLDRVCCRVLNELRSAQ